MQHRGDPSIELRSTNLAGASAKKRATCALRLSNESNVHDFEAAFKALHWIISHCRPPLVGYKSGIPEIGDRIGDEPEVEFLLVVDFLAAGHPCDVDVADAVNVIA